MIEQGPLGLVGVGVCFSERDKEGDIGAKEMDGVIERDSLREAVSEIL